MNRIVDFSTPVTLKTFRNSKGEEYILKGAPEKILLNEGQIPGTPYNHKPLKLYKKATVDGLDTFQLVGKKDTRYSSFVDKPMSIQREVYDPKTGQMVEQSGVYHNIGGGKTIECNGDVFKMQGSVTTNIANNKPKIEINLQKGKLTPMAKRILKILNK